MTQPTDSTETTRLPATPPGSANNGANTSRPVSPPSTPTGGTGLGLDAAQGKRLGLMAVLLVLIGAGVSFMGAALMESQYAARSQLIYDIREAEPTGFLREDRNLTTQLILLESRTVLEPVATTNGLTVEELDAKLTASVIEGSEIIDVELLAPSRGTGLLLANAVNERYLAVVNDDGPDSTRAYLEGQLVAVQGQLDTATPEEASSLADRRSDLAGQLDALNLAGPQATVLVPAYSAEEAVSPQPLVAAAAGGLAGVLIAAVVAGLVVRRWTKR